jgi:hypothetical protein
MASTKHVKKIAQPEKKHHIDDTEDGWKIATKKK